eukprot:262308-Pelagomonas_calceolata.AAC.2
MAHNSYELCTFYIDNRTRNAKCRYFDFSACSLYGLASTRRPLVGVQVGGRQVGCVRPRSHKAKLESKLDNFANFAKAAFWCLQLAGQ